MPIFGFDRGTALAVAAPLLAPLERYSKHDNGDLELVVVMLVSPTLLNILQLWIQDSFLKERHSILALPTAFLTRGYSRGRTQSNRLGKSFRTVRGTCLPHVYAHITHMSIHIFGPSLDQYGNSILPCQHPRLRQRANRTFSFPTTFFYFDDSFFRQRVF